MRPPREEVDRKDDQISTNDIRVRRRLVFEEKNRHLYDTEPRHAEQRSERAPFRPRDKEYDTPQQRKTDKQPPRVFTGKAKPEQTERGSDPLTALKFHRHGENMPDNDEQSAKIPRKIGHEHACSRKHDILIHEIGYERGNTALERVAKKRDYAYFQTELTTHIHRAGIPAADLRDIAFFQFRNEQRKIETADKIAYYRPDQKLPPVFRKYKFFHKSSKIRALQGVHQIENDQGKTPVRRSIA